MNGGSRKRKERQKRENRRCDSPGGVNVTGGGRGKSVEKERPDMGVKRIFLKNEFYMEANHLLLLSNLKLP